MRGKGFKPITLGIMTAVCAAVFLSCGTKTVKEDALVMKIGNETVVKAEYQMILKKYAAWVKMQYTTEEANRKDFWTRKWSNGRPLEQIMELAKEELAEKKTVVEMAKEAGLFVSLDYNDMEEERRNHTNQSMYGVAEFELGDYYEYVYTGIEADLEEALKKEYKISDEELKEAYQERISEFTSEIAVDILAAEISEGAEEGLYEEITAKLAEETDEKKLSEEYQDVDFYTASLSSLDPQEGKSGIYYGRWEASSALMEGEVSKPVAIPGKTILIRCLSRKENVAEPFENVKGILESEILTAKAKEQIEEAIQKADVVTEDADLEKIALDALE